MINPRDDFRKQHAKTWPDVVDSTMFQQAVSAAMLQMNLFNSNPVDLGNAASFQWRMEGAKQFLRILMHLADPEEQKTKTAQDRLNYRI